MEGWDQSGQRVGKAMTTKEKLTGEKAGIDYYEKIRHM